MDDVNIARAVISKGWPWRVEKDGTRVLEFTKGRQKRMQKNRDTE